MEYSFVGALTVADKVSHVAIHGDDELAPLRDYFNLLVRPKARGWERFEPSLRQRHWHGDWLWRIVKTDHRKDVVARAATQHRPGHSLKIEGHRVKFADNYVVFSADPR